MIGRGELVVLLVILGTGVAARCYEAGYNFDTDEVFSVQLAGRSFSKVIELSLQDRPHPPLHNVLLHFWMLLFGDSEISARALSILFSAGFLGLGYLLLRRLMSPWVALGTLAIFAWSPFFVYFGQQVRPYSLIACAAAANLLAFVWMNEAPNERKRVLLWAASCTVLLYAQYLAALTIGLEMAWALLAWRDGRRAMLGWGLLASGLIAPWMLTAMAGSILGLADPLPHIAWLEKPTAGDFLWFYVGIFGVVPGLKVRWLLIVLALLGITGIVAAVRAKKVTRLCVFMVLAGIGLPAVVCLLSVWGPKPIFAARQLMGPAIAFVVVVGLCAEALPRIAGLPLLAMIAVWTAAALPEAFPLNSKPPWRELAEYVDEHYGAEPVVVQEEWIRDPLGYYRRAGPVLLWQEMSEREKKEVSVIVTRPGRDGLFLGLANGARARLKETWRWGLAKDGGDFGELRLHEVK